MQTSQGIPSQLRHLLQSQANQASAQQQGLASSQPGITQQQWQLLQLQQQRSQPAVQMPLGQVCNQILDTINVCIRKTFGETMKQPSSPTVGRLSTKRLWVKNAAFCCYRNEQRFHLLLLRNNTIRVVTQTYLNSDHMIDFCAVSPHDFDRNQHRLSDDVSQVYETSVSTKRVHTKQTTHHFVVRNEQRFESRHSNIFLF